MVRERAAERLADLAIKMADQNICQLDINFCQPCQAENVFLNSARPVHVAFLQHKVPCPPVFCKRNVCFYKEDGLDHHFRIVHHFPAGDERREAKERLQILHGEETIKCLKKISDLRATQVFNQFYCIFLVNRSVNIKNIYFSCFSYLI